MDTLGTQNLQSRSGECAEDFAGVVKHKLGSGRSSRRGVLLGRGLLIGLVY